MKFQSNSTRLFKLLMLFGLAMLLGAPAAAQLNMPTAEQRLYEAKYVPLQLRKMSIKHKNPFSSGQSTPSAFKKQQIKKAQEKHKYKRTI